MLILAILVFNLKVPEVEVEGGNVWIAGVNNGAHACCKEVELLICRQRFSSVTLGEGTIVRPLRWRVKNLNTYSAYYYTIIPSPIDQKKRNFETATPIVLIKNIHSIVRYKHAPHAHGE